MLTNEDLDKMDATLQGVPQCDLPLHFCLPVDEAWSLIAMARECLKLREDVRLWEKLFSCPKDGSGNYCVGFFRLGFGRSNDGAWLWYVWDIQKEHGHCGGFDTPLNALREIEKRESRSPQSEVR